MPRAANLKTSGVVERASDIRMLLSLKGIDMTTAAPPSAPETIRSVLLGLLGVPPSVAVESTAVSPDDALAQPDTAKVYEFTSVDYPGAAQTLVFDTDGTTALGAFIFDPEQLVLATRPHSLWREGLTRSSTSPTRPQASQRVINTSGLIVGAYDDVAGSAHGFSNQRRQHLQRRRFPRSH